MTSEGSVRNAKNSAKSVSACLGRYQSYCQDDAFRNVLARASSFAFAFLLPTSVTSQILTQGHWPPLQLEETSALLMQPELAKLISMNPMDAINPEQDSASSKAFTILKRHIPQNGRNSAVGNVYWPSGKLCGTISLDRLQILQHAFNTTKHKQPEVHQNPSFEQAVARLSTRYRNKYRQENGRCKSMDDTQSTHDSPQPRS